MRLLSLNEATSEWILEDFTAPAIPFYAILSHTWGADKDEVKFEDIANGRLANDQNNKPGDDKLLFCHRMAKADGLRYFWIDTCCIKKSDSSELQRSLSSMFYWYQKAVRCYVFLADVSSRDHITHQRLSWEEAFVRSKWFTRGWTLQELIAPMSVVFYSKDGDCLGDKVELVSTISKVTKIPEPALRGLDLSRYSAQERLKWAKDRKTSVPEDSAYCLIGIFDVQLYMLYADGDPNKRRQAAMSQLLKAIADKDDLERNDEVICIGGARFNNLTALSNAQLVSLDTDLESFIKWVLETPSLSIDKDISTFSLAAGVRMRKLFEKYDIAYDDESEIERKWPSWKEPWTAFADETAPEQTRLRALADNRFWWMLANENCIILATALRTLEALMIWRGKWQPNA